MPELTVIWWRDIPAQVMAKEGRASARAQLAGALPGGDRRSRDARGPDRDATPTSRSGAASHARAATISRPRSPRRSRGSRARTPTTSSSGSSRSNGQRLVTETVLSSATKEVVIGFERPFVIIGERINPTGRKKLAEEMAAGNFDTVVADAIAQVEAGAQMLDVNAGIPLADEPAILARGDRARAGRHGRPALHRLVDRRGARGRARRLPGQGARQLGDGRGGAAGVACSRSSRSTEPQSSRSRTTSRESPRTRTCASRSRAGSSPAPPTTGSRRRTSSSTRSSCPSARSAAPGARCSGSCGVCARSSASTRPAAPRT